MVTVVEKCVELMTDRYRRRGVRLEFAKPAAAKIVRGDASQLRQVLLNVLLNALDASLINQTVTIRFAAEPSGRGARGHGFRHRGRRSRRRPPGRP
ncbi:MAG: hypothetical protein QM775_12340 [Pirellulales bacterium]